MTRPATTAVTLEFAATTPPYSPSNPHKGVDFSHSPDSTIYAPESGTVELRPNDGTSGRAIHMFVGNRHHALCHTSKYLVGNGEKVTEGQPVAIMGDTGAAIGVHLHWAVMVDGKLVNGLTLLEEDEMSAQDVTNLQNQTNELRNEERANVQDLNNKINDVNVKLDKLIASVDALGKRQDREDEAGGLEDREFTELDKINKRLDALEGK